jgi:hypothetical protein
MTEAEYIKRLPFLNEFPAELRASFTEAMNDLDGTVKLLAEGEGVDVADVVGLIVLDEPNPGALVISRALCLVQAAKDTLTPHMMKALRSPASPNKMHVLVIAGDRRVLFEAPVKVIRLLSPNGEN